jgi:hypothetical protein
MNHETITRFEHARETYLIATALVDTINEERERWHRAHGVTRETMRSWLGNDTAMPSDLAAINDAALDAVFARSDARRALIAAAREITAVLARKHGFGAEKLDELFDHMESRPYSPPSQKALDAILRVDVRR